MASFNTNLLTDFVTDAMETNTAEEIMALLQRVADAYGLEHFAISGLPLPGERIDPYVLVNAWPDEWVSRYQVQNYVHYDPVIHATRQSNEPFVWSEKIIPLPLNKHSRRVMNEASHFGMKDGFAVPLHGVSGLQAIVTFSAGSIDMSEEMRATLQLIATYAHSRVRNQFMRKDTHVQPPHVTPREKEVLRWLAEGKTALETSDILSVSASTVRSHIENLRLKLDCSNSAQLVAEGFRLGIIR